MSLRGLSEWLTMTRIATGLLLAFALAGCVTLNTEVGQATFRPVSPAAPSDGEAVINFVHVPGIEDMPVPLSIGYPASPVPLFFSSENLFQLWDGQGLAGFLPMGTACVQVRVKPGKQVFLGRFVRSNAGDWTVLSGDVAAGRTYFIRVSQRWNTWKPAVQFQVIPPGELATRPAMACRKPVAYDRSPPTSAAFWDNHLAKNREAVDRAFADLSQGRRTFYFDPVLQAENGMPSVHAPDP